MAGTTKILTNLNFIDALTDIVTQRRWGHRKPTFVGECKETRMNEVANAFWPAIIIGSALVLLFNVTRN
jgi:hypothetical protein